MSSKQKLQRKTDIPTTIIALIIFGNTLFYFFAFHDDYQYAMYGVFNEADFHVYYHNEEEKLQLNSNKAIMISDIT